ncbi:YybS family protein [Paraliobacillus sp. JSM ZJ581]|uniref:YybS family protein n=1 Tax=Paraliobacillus sp. JSM ZJ581 TaxID=3342118 RepID=UPI0035A973CF
MNDIQKLKEGLTMGSLFGLLLLIVVFIPGSELIALFVLPVPFVLYASRYGYRSTLLLGGIVLGFSVILSLFLFIGAIPLTLLAISAGAFIGHAIFQKRHSYETWALGSVGVTIGLLIIFVMIQVFSEVDLIEQYQSVIDESIEITKSMTETTGFQLAKDDLDLIKQQMNQMITLFPSILVLISIGIAFIIQWTSYKIISFRNKKRLSFPAFRTFQFPKGVIWIYLIAILLAMFPIEETGSLAAVVLNTTNLIGGLFSLQGISFILFYCHQKRLSIAYPILIILSCIIFLPIGIYLTRILGIIDIGFGVRGRMKQTK